jgi:hypothetical protein
MLVSDDLEMVQLGAHWVQESLPQEEWQSAVDLINYDRFWYLLSEGGITVGEQFFQYESRRITLKTGQGGMTLINQAMKDYAKKDDTGRASI